MNQSELFREIRACEAAVESEVAYITESTGISRDRLLATTKGRAHVSRARQLLMYRLRMIHGLSFPIIGLAIGRDHTTVLHGVRKMKRLLDEAA